MRLKRFQHFLNEATLKNINNFLVRKYCKQYFDQCSKIFKTRYSDIIEIENKLFKNEEDNIVYKEAVLEFIKSIFYFEYDFNHGYSGNILSIFISLDLNSPKYYIISDDQDNDKSYLLKDFNTSIIFNIINNTSLIKDIEKIFDIKFFINLDINLKIQYNDINDIISKISKYDYIEFEINLKKIRNEIEHTDKASNIKSTFKYITIPSIDIDDITEENVYTILPWLRDCYFINADIRIIDNKLYWNNGTWLSGTWKDGIWYDGNWQDGEWENGIWYDGRFIKGKWYNGKFNDGEFSGIWYDGIFEDGTFEKGEWHNGIFNNGIFNNSDWKYGQFKGGYFQNSLWHDGIFYDGGVRNATWMYGLWISGHWITGEWHDGVKLNNTGGLIEDQNWHEGIIVNDPTNHEELHDALEEKDIKINNQILKAIEEYTKKSM